MTHQSSLRMGSSVLLPFTLDEHSRNVHSFWHTIFPASKRLITSDGEFLGNDTDVRQPKREELWFGSFITVGLPRLSTDSDYSRPVKVTIDAVFFEDGAFVGPNKLHWWEQITSLADAHLMYADMARKTRATNKPVDRFFLQVQTLTAQSKPVHALRAKWLNVFPLHLRLARRDAKRIVGNQVLRLRDSVGSDVAFSRVEKLGSRTSPQVS